MADIVEQERTEQPTPKRRADARAAGLIPRSQELTTAATVLCSALALSALAPALGRGVLAAFGRGLVRAAESAPALDAQGAVAIVRDTGWRTVGLLAPVMLAVLGATLAVAAAQARGVLSAKPLGPDWSRLSPLANARRAGGAEPWAELARSLGKLAVLGAAVWAALRHAWPDLMALAQEPAAALPNVIRHHAVRLFVGAGAGYLAVGVLDYLWQLRRHEQRLRMTRAEVRQEERETEGDPVVRQRMRGAGRALVRRRQAAAGGGA
jgi:flagellar biosynthetic protein FlhB